MVKNVRRHRDEQREHEQLSKAMKELKFDEKLKEFTQKKEQFNAKQVNKVKYFDAELEERMKKFIEEKKLEEQEDKFNKSLINRSIASKR